MSKNPKELMKVENFLNKMRTFNEIFQKNVAFGIIKSHKKQGFTVTLKKVFLEKRQGMS